MSKESLRALINKTINYTKEGLELLLEVDELQAAAKNMPKTKDYYQLVKEIVEKEKVVDDLFRRLN